MNLAALFSRMLHYNERSTLLIPMINVNVYGYMRRSTTTHDDWKLPAHYSVSWRQENKAG